MSPPEALRYVSLVVCGLICLLGLVRTKNPGFLVMAVTVIGWPLLVPQLQRWVWVGWREELSADVQRWHYLTAGFAFAYYALAAVALALLDRFGSERKS